MKIKQATYLHSAVIAVLMHTKGLGSMSDADRETVSEASLSDILLANSMMNDHKGSSADGGTVVFLTTTDQALAELYLRVHDKDFMTAVELQELCQAMDDAFEDTSNGHAVLVDAADNYSLIELDHAGDGALRTLKIAASPREIYDYVLGKLSEVDA
jgi:hypothetical protein